ncbi:unnamed protein product [Protopolystoma xenopodis]|uniref:Uncharacterized protein n=1 Tax=Protopolystoma xenopodis TaxID=117903 RepID=A0A448XE50_9PLAT|nr:unnamed protein product [Protopolystoma xenopodis]
MYCTFRQTGDNVDEEESNTLGHWRLGSQQPGALPARQHWTRISQNDTEISQFDKMFWCRRDISSWISLLLFGSTYLSKDILIQPEVECSFDRASADLIRNHSGT